MLLSALLTSVGINSSLCVIFFTLYSILRKQPTNYQVYAPRLLAGGHSGSGNRFKFERLIPSPGWVKSAWKLSEEELLSSSGLDALVFMRLLKFCLKAFSFAGIIGIFVLLPINCTGDALHEIDFADLPSNSLDIFTISNVNNGSKRLWFHFSAVYLFTIFVCCLLYYEYRYLSSKRIAYFHSSEPQPDQFTILVRSIPISRGGSVSNSVDNFFLEYYPTTYLSHAVVHRSSRLLNLLNKAKGIYRRLIRLQSEPNEQKQRRIGLFGHKVNLMDHYEKKLEDIEEDVRLEQLDASSVNETRAAFVSFKSRYGAAVACHLQQSNNPTHWVTEQAPQPDDVYWPFFYSSFMNRWVSKIMIILACTLLTILFLIPVVVVQGLTNLNQLEIWFPFLKNVLKLTFVSQVVTGYLPSLILQLFLKAVPPIMVFLSSIQGYISYSAIEKSSCSKVHWFTVWNIFFATVFSGSVLYQVSIVLDPRNIPSKLAISVPSQASFFIAYVVTSGWTSASSELVRIAPLLGLISSCCGRNKDSELEVPAIPYHSDIPRILFFGLLGITYFFLAPLILPFLLIYFGLAFIIFRNQFINVYAPKYETGGKFWPIAHNSMIFSLVLMHAISVGIFTLKKLPMASTLIFPLAVLTLLFNEYCRKRFLPIFSSYSAEALIKKDKADQNDASMPEFLDNLVTAYKDPALNPIKFSSSISYLSSPLLASSSEA